MVLLSALLSEPWARSTIQVGLRAVDGMSSKYSLDDQGEMVIVKTAAGGWFTVLAVLLAVAASSSLLKQHSHSSISMSEEYTTSTTGTLSELTSAGPSNSTTPSTFRAPMAQCSQRNNVSAANASTVSVDELRVAAQDVPGAGRAAGVRTDVVLDVAIPNTQLVGCLDALQLTVAQGHVSITSNDGQAALGKSLMGLTASVEIQELATGGGYGASLCWMRAICTDCGLTEVTSLRVDAHWAAQVVGWRLATMDAESAWSLESGVAVPPAIDAGVPNASMYADEMLSMRTEAIALVGHLLMDQSDGSETVLSEGFKVHNTHAGLTSTRLVGSIDVNVSMTRLQIEVHRSVVFAVAERHVVVGAAGGGADSPGSCNCVGGPVVSGAGVVSTERTVSTSSEQGRRTGLLVGSIAGLAMGIILGIRALYSILDPLLNAKLAWMCGHRAFPSRSTRSPTVA